MMMKMLDAAGIEPLIDNIRTADEDNPKGYYELERVKELDKTEDKAWLADSRGKGIKVISFLLKDLPETHEYKVIFMRRDLDEILASQRKMLERRGEPYDAEGEAALKARFESHLWRVGYLMRTRSHFETLEVGYRDALEHPGEQARRVDRFLGKKLDVEKMAKVADRSLYRNRK